MLMPLAFFLGSAITTNFRYHSARHRHRNSVMELNKSVDIGQTAPTAPSIECRKPRILCLHGKFQSGYIFSNKIAGARRKIEREYELHFLDGPILLSPTSTVDEDGSCNNEGIDVNVEGDERLAPRSWWLRSEEGEHTLVREAFEYVMQQTELHEYDAILGFSQGGTLATALALSGAFPNVRAVCTAGAPHIAEAFEVSSELCKNNAGFEIPKLHLAGETDSLVAVESTRELCQKGGNGKLILHDQGHLFPTRSARVKEILDFLGAALTVKHRTGS